MRGRLTKTKAANAAGLSRRTVIRYAKAKLISEDRDGRVLLAEIETAMRRQNYQRGDGKDGIIKVTAKPFAFWPKGLVPKAPPDEEKVKNIKAEIAGLMLELRDEVGEERAMLLFSLHADISRQSGPAAYFAFIQLMAGDRSLDKTRSKQAVQQERKRILARLAPFPQFNKIIGQLLAFWGVRRTTVAA